MLLERLPFKILTVQWNPRDSSAIFVFVVGKHENTHRYLKISPVVFVFSGDILFFFVNFLRYHIFYIPNIYISNFYNDVEKIYILYLSKKTKFIT